MHAPRTPCRQQSRIVPLSVHPGPGIGRERETEEDDHLREGGDEDDDAEEEGEDQEAGESAARGGGAGEEGGDLGAVGVEAVED